MAQLLAQAEAEHRDPRQQQVEAGPGEPQQLAVDQDPRRRRPGLTGDERHLAEPATLAQLRHHLLGSRLSRQHDLHPAPCDDEHVVAVVLHLKEHRAGGHVAGGHLGGHHRQQFRGEITKQGDLAEDVGDPGTIVNVVHVAHYVLLSDTSAALAARHSASFSRAARWPVAMMSEA